MTTSPLVSVLIPTRNRWHILSRHALAGALSQEDVDLEVLVIDDGSDDGVSLAALQAVEDPRLRVLRHHSRRGQAHALNTGISEARGEWVAFLDDDDLWAPQKLRAQLNAADARGADFVYGSIVIVDEAVRPLEAFPTVPPDDVARLLRSHNVLRTPSSVSARTSLVRSVGGLDERLNELSDWDFFIRIADAGRAAACEEVVVAYYVHPQNRRVRDDCDVDREFEYLANKHANSDGGVHRAGFDRWVAMGHLRAGRRFAAARAYLTAGVRHLDFGGVARAAGALVGEPAVALRRRLRERPEPPWLKPYRR